MHLDVKDVRRNGHIIKKRMNIGEMIQITGPCDAVTTRFENETG